MMIKLSGDGGTPTNRVVESVCSTSTYPNSYHVPSDESFEVGQVLTEKQFRKVKGWTELILSDISSSRLIEDLYDYIDTGTVSDPLKDWVKNKKDARNLFIANRSRAI